MVKQTQTKVTMIKLGVAKLKGTTIIFINNTIVSFDIAIWSNITVTVYL